mgnify:CR=1 FL=1
MGNFIITQFEEMKKQIKEEIKKEMKEEIRDEIRSYRDDLFDELEGIFDSRCEEIEERLKELEYAFEDFGDKEKELEETKKELDKLKKEVQSYPPQQQHHEKRLTFRNEYLMMNVWVTFTEDGVTYEYPHDELLIKIFYYLDTIVNTKSWIEKGIYHTPRLSKEHKKIMEQYIIKKD